MVVEPARRGSLLKRAERDAGKLEAEEIAYATPLATAIRRTARRHFERHVVPIVKRCWPALVHDGQPGFMRPFMASPAKAG